MDRSAVNIPARRAYAELLRHVFAGRLTNLRAVIRAELILDKHESDPGVELIHEIVNNEFYSDLRVHRYTDQSLPVSKEARRVLARVVAFLYSDKPPSRDTECPRLLRQDLQRVDERSWTSFVTLAFGLFAIGPLPGMIAYYHYYSEWWVLIGFALVCAPLVVLSEKQDRNAAGAGMRGTIEKNEADDGVWPFASVGDLQDAMRHPVLLAGRARMPAASMER